jgi:UDP-N-acetylmuramoyl-L-alanyl-D-glutamate--2,6-diaminopimelate ligase
VRLDTLLSGLDGAATLTGDGAVEVSSVAMDSRRVAPGALFCCVRGARVDGHDLAAAAVADGAAALLVERPLGLGVPEVLVADSRAAVGPVASRFLGDPSHDLTVVGVTGTNGKTTTVALLAAIFEAAGRPAAVIGTLTGASAPGAPRPPTTPDAIDLQTRLAELAQAGTAAVAVEVSSHAMVQHRVAGTRFDLAVFTNLSRDHLDLHPTMEHYFAAKAALFEPGLTAAGVVNADDPHGRLLADSARIPTTTWSLADAVDLEVGVASSTFTWEGQRIELPLGGRFNVSNALGAATAARELGVVPADVAAGLASVGPVDGRYEIVEAGPPFTVVVDYAHTPDGIEQVLRASRAAVGDGRVLVVFGCGGDRDREKRPAMGEAATRLADVAVLTSDNPRSEDPTAIIDQVRAGTVPGARLEVEPDRRRAIARALAEAGEGDVVVVAGKGHETTQTIGSRVLPFDDRVVVREELDRLRSAGGLRGVTR